MKLIRSNRTENLVEALASRIEREPPGPFSSEAIVVQSRGMERWLTLTLAERLGIWSHPSFPFPRTAIERVLEDLALGPTKESEAYAPSTLKWSIAELLQQETPRELQSYLGAFPDPDRALRLATTLASMFDEYVVYRPSLLRSWERGLDTQWQANLWRRLSNRLGPHDLATRIEHALPVLSGQPSNLRYARLHLLSLETLPPLFLHFFQALSRAIPTHLYLLTPTTEYLSDVSPGGQLSLGLEPDRAEGHPLLSSLGGLAREFQELLLDSDSGSDGEEEQWALPGRDTLLASLQSDILELKSPPGADQRTVIDSWDKSITIHACTSPMREVLVLHDLIREALEEDSSLLPEHIVVMAPDLEAYAPAFRAVFGQSDGESIPYEVHDRRARGDTDLYDDFLAALEVLESRFSVLDVVRLMDAQCWREDLRFSPTERTRLTSLLEAAGVRWGIDDSHREALGFPADSLHTWRSGLGRLFLGFAEPPESARVFQGLLPRGESSLTDASLIARLSRFSGVLFDFHERVRAPLPLTAWSGLLGQLAQELFSEEDDASGAVRILRNAVEELRYDSEAYGYERALPLRTVRRELASAVARDTPAAGFLRRGVTLSELVPLRSIPFRMVCLIGMSEEAFPRTDDRPSFDLLRSGHSLGDRDKRNDDRHSFLQALLCARDRLAISYSAPATSTRTAPTPSPVVWELIESVEQYYQRQGADSALDPIRHPLHAFDRAYFESTSSLSSFSTRYLQVAREIGRPVIEVPHVDLRAEPDPTPHTLSIRDLSQWLWHPCREFIQKRLGTRFDDTTLYEPTGALVELGNLDAFRVGNEALERQVAGEAMHSFLRAAPEFPDGSWGRAERNQLANEVETLLMRRADTVGRGEVRTEIVRTTVGDLILEGRIDGIYEDKRVKHRFNRAETKTELSTWLEHLLLQASAAPDLPGTTELVLRATGARAGTVCFAPVENASELLTGLVSLYQQSQEVPAALLNRASWAFAAAVHEGRAERALDHARKRFQQDQRWDRYVRFVWGKAGPFSDQDWTERFGTTTRAVYGPLFVHRSER